MAATDFFTIIATSAVVAAGVNWLRAELSDRTTRSASYVLDQLRHLYGPLSFYATQNECLVSVHSVISAAYDEEYVQVQYSDDEMTQASIEKQTDITIQLSNRYGAKWTENNQAMVAIIRDNYGLIDPDDADLFQSFAAHTIRSDYEKDETAPPFSIRMHLGSPNVYRSDFVDAIKTRFAAKKGELDELRKPPCWKFWAKKPPVHASIDWKIVTPNERLPQHREMRRAAKEKQEEIKRSRESS